MKGAVLYKLGLALVKERMMRMSYGTETSAVFRPNYHPEYRRYLSDAGARCRGVMDWFAFKVFPSSYAG